MGRNSERVSRANHKTNKRMSIFRYTQVRSYKTVPNDFFVELKRYFVTQGFKIKRFQYTETSGQMVGRKDGWHLNFVPKFVLDIKQVHGVHFITFNYFARVRKIGIASGIATQGITALIGAATITGYLVAARNLVDAVGKAMDALAGNPLSVEWVEKEEAGEETKPGDTTTSAVTYNTTNIQNVGPEPNANSSNTKETNTVVEHHHHYYYAGQNGEHGQPMAPPASTSTPAPALMEEPFIHEVEAPQHRPTIMPSEPAQPIYRQSDLEKELISMLERGDSLSTPELDMPAANPFMGGANASVYDNQHHGNGNNQYRDTPSPQFFSGGAHADMQSAEPAHNPFTYEDNTPMPQYNLPAQHAPLYSIEPLSYNNKMDGGFRLEELREIAPALPPKNPFFVPLSNNAMKPQQHSDDPFADLSLENVAGAYGMKTHHQPGAVATGEYGYARN